MHSVDFSRLATCGAYFSGATPSYSRKHVQQHEISEEEHFRWWSKMKESDACRYLIYKWDSIPAGVVGFTNIDRASRNASWALYAALGVKRVTGRAWSFWRPITLSSN